MRTHIKIVGLVNLLYSALGMLVAAGVLFSGIFGSLATFNPIIVIVGTVTGLLAAAVIGLFSLFGLIAGFALLNHQQWARYVILAVSAFRLFKWPFGTAFGAYSIWVLTTEETRQIFALNS
ncbi:MAG TPA: hypothetical protein VGE27_09330 [Gemmatimonas sp.]|uniref:hypothetical protein n=1 Tax=Gemmatimonas sp. TaxID=1962908 RepID=UPI002EDB2FF7